MALQITDELIHKLQVIHDNTILEIFKDYDEDEIDFDRFNEYIFDYFTQNLKKEDFILDFIVNNNIAEDEINTAFIFLGNYNKYSKKGMTVFFFQKIKNSVDDILDNFPAKTKLYVLKSANEDLDDDFTIIEDKEIKNMIDSRYECFRNS